MGQIVLISGRTCTGKSNLARLLAQRFGYIPVHTGEIVHGVALDRGLKTDRQALQALGDLLDQETGSRWVLSSALAELSKSETPGRVVVDNIRTGAQLEHFRTQRDAQVIHVHLYAEAAELRQRFARKLERLKDESATRYSDVDLIKHEEDVDRFKADADVRINTSWTDSEDTLVRVIARLSLYSPPDYRCVDVLVGGQFGSEGKGHVSAYLAKDYDVLVRVGGPNAGHTVSSSSGIYTYHQLPSGARDTNSKLLLGPGMTIRVDELTKEIADCRVTADRLFIDPQAMIIESVDIEQEQGLVAAIASTGRGGGAAAARRIVGRGPNAVRLARDVPELAQYVGDGPNYRGSTSLHLERAYRRGHSVLLEGTQGSGLSIYHGQYPHVTSRDTNVAGCLAEAGIPPTRVRRVLMVIRPTPIRVANSDAGNTSGLLKHEVTFRRVAEKAGLDPDEVETNELTSTTRRKRRVGWFEWDQFRRACELNSPTDLVLTFADYLSVENRKARRFEQLTQDTIKFIEEIERVAQAPVSLINTRFPRETEKIDLRTIIDRRTWTTSRQMSENGSFSELVPIERDERSGGAASARRRWYWGLVEWLRKR